MNLLAKHSHKELSKTSFSTLFEQIRNSKLPLRLRCALFEALRDDLLLKLVQLRNLNEHFSEVPFCKEPQPVPAPEPTEAELWAELDRIEIDIMLRRDQKILLGSMLDNYDDQLFEQQRILEFKANENRELKGKIELKRKEIQQERRRYLLKEGSLSINTTGLSNASINSPRMPSSPRLLGSPRLGRLFNWR